MIKEFCQMENEKIIYSKEIVINRGFLTKGGKYLLNGLVWEKLGNESIVWFLYEMKSDDTTMFYITHNTNLKAVLKELNLESSFECERAFGSNLNNELCIYMETYNDRYVSCWLRPNGFSIWRVHLLNNFLIHEGYSYYKAIEYDIKKVNMIS